MRDIEFRGKRIDTGEWVYGGLIECAGHAFISLQLDGFTTHREAEYRWRCVSVVVGTVGQYTGLKDKNGKKIFEGDVFKFQDEAFESCETSCGTEYDSWDVENYAVVGFHEDTQAPDFVRYKFGENQVEADIHENHDIEFYDFVRGLEVIGNIHDNPELFTRSR